MEQSFTILSNNNQINNSYEDSIIIWLHNTIANSMKNQWFNITSQLRQIIRHLEVFTNVDECIKYVSSINITQTFLIVNVTYSDDFEVARFHEIIDNIFIYVYTSYPTVHNDYCDKIRGYFDDPHVLINKLHRDYMALKVVGVSDMNVSRMNSNENTVRFINPQLIKVKCMEYIFKILRRLPPPLNQSRTKMIEICRSYYAENAVQQRNIDKFEMEYQSEDAIQWYRRDNFLYLLCNRIFRTNAIDSIICFSFFTIDLYNQLSKVYCDQQAQQILPHVVYRGQYISLDELEKLKHNVGEYISLNSSWTTRRNNLIPSMFIDSVPIKDHVSIIFEIHIEPNFSSSKPFADVPGLSCFFDEHLILFSYGTIFQILSCNQVRKYFWSFQLKLCDHSSIIGRNTKDYFDVAMLRLLEIFPQISPKTNKANDRMLERCRLYYKNDLTELAKIDEFENNYRSDSAIRWYTKDSFLYRLLNMALRHENIDMIIDFQYFIIDLYEQLTISHIHYVKTSKEPTITVYRGQKLSLSELYQLKHNVTKYISIKPFFSTSLSCEVALLHADLDEIDRKQLLQSVLFVINIDMNKLVLSNRNNLFANIMHLSHNRDEQEVLFMVNTRFQVTSVTNLNEIIWVVHLTLWNQNDETNDEMKVMNQCLDSLSELLKNNISGDLIRPEVPAENRRK